jgi:hypothetical protein
VSREGLHPKGHCPSLWHRTHTRSSPAAVSRLQYYS